MDKILNITIKILIVLWVMLCIGGALVMYSEIPLALTAPEEHYPFGKGDLGWRYATLQIYVLWSGIFGTWFVLGGIISILAWKYPRYRIYVLFHFITTYIYLMWIRTPF